MSDSIQQAITTLEMELGTLDTRRNDVMLALEHLRPLVGGTRATKKPERTNERTNARPAPRPRAVRSLPDDAPPTGRQAIVSARDEAIVAALKKGPAPSAGLIHVLPKESGQTADQREGALRNALMRLKAKKVIELVDEGWALV